MCVAHSNAPGKGLCWVVQGTLLSLKSVGKGRAGVSVLPGSNTRGTQTCLKQKLIYIFQIIFTNVNSELFTLSCFLFIDLIHLFLISTSIIWKCLSSIYNVWLNRAYIYSQLYLQQCIGAHNNCVCMCAVLTMYVKLFGNTFYSLKSHEGRRIGASNLLYTHC